MAYAKVTILNTETGQEEEFLTRISPRGIADWLADREVLQAAGNPDRPPDVDTPTMRAWVQWPGEEDLPYFKNQKALAAQMADARPFITVYGVHWSSPQGRHAWLSVVGYTDAAGGYTSALASNDQRAYPSISKEHPATVPEEEVWAEIEELVAIVNEDQMWNAVSVTTYLDTQWFESEMALAEAEVARGFMSMPEGRA